MYKHAGRKNGSREESPAVGREKKKERIGTRKQGKGREDEGNGRGGEGKRKGRRKYLEMEREKRFKWRICNERGNQNRRKGRNERNEGCEMKPNREKGSWGRRMRGRGDLE